MDRDMVNCLHYLYQWQQISRAQLDEQDPKKRLFWCSGDTMVVSCQQEKKFFCPLLQAVMQFVYSRAYAGAEPSVATFDHSDIRGLVTGKTCFRRGAASV